MLKMEYNDILLNHHYWAPTVIALIRSPNAVDTLFVAVDHNIMFVKNV
jgi:hypothetical protein